MATKFIRVRGRVVPVRDKQGLSGATKTKIGGAVAIVAGAASMRAGQALATLSKVAKKTAAASIQRNHFAPLADHAANFQRFAKFEKISKQAGKVAGAANKIGAVAILGGGAALAGGVAYSSLKAKHKNKFGR